MNWVISTRMILWKGLWPVLLLQVGSLTLLCHALLFVRTAVVLGVTSGLIQRRTGIQSLFSAQDEYCMYYDFFDASSIRTAVDDLDEYIATEGPFDGVLAFSMGAALASTFMIRKAIEDPLGSSPVFKCAIFVSGARPFDYAALTRGEIRMIDESTDGVVINVPTANIWGSTDTEWPGAGVELKKLCGSRGRTEFVHEGGHEMPAGPKEVVACMANVVRGTIEDALIL